ncbi:MULTISPECIES: tyrosine-type recombinase/integrase [unclassified Microbacterium]|uniref:tyrosine-type recombinase/integrase n=1 Tax=unclassified Microbacterium TaxID=2609290 RepID=UPI003015CD05
MANKSGITPNVSKVTGKVISYTYRYRDHDDVQQRATFPTMKAAKAFKLNIELAKAHGSTTTAYVKRAQTFREVATASLDAVAADDRKDKTREGYDLAFRVHIFPTFGDRRINTITSMEVEAWLKDMRTKTSERTKKQLSQSTVHGSWIALNTVFKYAHRHGLIVANPCEAVKKPRVKVEKRREFPLQPGVVMKISRLLDEYAPYGLLVRFAAHTGLREGELAALRIGAVTAFGQVAAEVSVERSVRRVKGGWKIDTPKTKSGKRSVPLPRSIREEMADYLANHPNRHDPDAALWPGRIPGSAGDPHGLDYDRQFDIGSVIRYYFKKQALTPLGITGVRWHDLRHYYATVMISQIGKGAQYTLYEVSRWMGHASYQTTVDVYGHLLDKRADVDVLDDIMRAAEAEASNITPLRRAI